MRIRLGVTTRNAPRSSASVYRTFHSNNFNMIESVNIRDNAGSLSISDLTACEYLRFRSSKVAIYTRSTIDHLFMWKINSLI